MTTERDDELEALFAEARGLRPVPGDDLMARLLADAAREMPRPTPRVEPNRPGWRDWVRVLGGWPAIGGLAAASAVGVWLGAAPPAGLTTLAPGIWGEEVSVALGVDEDPLSLLEG